MLDRLSINKSIGSRANDLQQLFFLFDLFFDTPAYRPVYVISDSEMKELQRTQNQDELEEIRHQKKKLEEAYKAQVKHLDAREKELKTELKAIEPAKKKV